VGEGRSGPGGWLSVREAVERILAAVAPLGVECVPLLEAFGRTLAEPAVSPVDHPPWDNSAMDGYAVRAADVRGARPDAPVVLEVIEAVPAGGFPTRAVGAGQAVRLMTGAPLPEGADSVVRLEHTAPAGPGRVAVRDDADAGRNVRPRGEDLRRGAVVVEAGRVLRPGELGVLAAAGYARVAVYRRPRVGILSTGDELAGLEEYDEVRAGRKIANSNSYAVAGAVRAAGGEPVLLGIARDDPADLRARLERACGLGLDALLTTAGASVGDHDLVKDVLLEMGFTLDFWRVRMRPGSPVSFGRLGGLPVFGLPGNPVSALVTFEVLVRPALRRMQGRTAVHPPTIRVRAAEPIPGRPGLTHFLRARLEPGEELPLARLTGPQGSALLHSMAAADALLVVPEDRAGVAAGEVLAAIPLPGPDPGRPEPGY